MSGIIISKTVVVAADGRKVRLSSINVFTIPTVAYCESIGQPALTIIIESLWIRPGEVMGLIIRRTSGRPKMNSRTFGRSIRQSPNTSKQSFRRILSRKQLTTSATWAKLIRICLQVDCWACIATSCRKKGKACQLGRNNLITLVANQESSLTEENSEAFHFGVSVILWIRSAQLTTVSMRHYKESQRGEPTLWFVTSSSATQRPISMN